MTSLPNEVPPTGPVPLPVSADQAAAYLAIVAAMPRHRMKDYVRDIHNPAFFIDIAALERDLDAGKVPSSQTTHAVRGSQWGLSIAAGSITQSDGGTLDLLYAASMPEGRTLKPLIFIDFPEGRSMVDGSHRMARAMIDGRTTQPGTVVDYADIAPYRVAEAAVESGA